MTELSTFEAFRLHAAGCRSCRLGSGVACDEGQLLHKAWRDAAEADQREQKQERMRRERDGLHRKPTQRVRRSA
jgi:hypothetical protein